MSAFDPKSTRVHLQELAARTVARTTLTDLREGSDLHHLLYAAAQGYAANELAIARVRDAFFFEGGSGAALDARISDLPGGLIERLGPSTASGGNCTLFRTDTSGDLLVEAGASYSRSDDATQIYRQVADATFLDGQDSVSGVAVVCNVPGVAGNAEAGQIDIVLNAEGVVRVANLADLVNGSDGETDEELIERGRLLLAGLTGTTGAALEGMARRYESSDGARARFVRVHEDPRTPAYAELLLDDGSGLTGYRREGDVSTGIIPSGGPAVLWHETPSINEISLIRLTSGGVIRELEPDEFTSFPERGLVYLEDGVASAGDTWEISKYYVWVSFPREIQLLIEGDLSDPVRSPGHRASGGRVRVVAPLEAPVSFWVNVVPKSGRDLQTVSDDVVSAIVGYVSALAPGEPLYTPRLIARLIENQDVLTVRFFSSEGGEACLGDIFPPSQRHVLRTSSERISVIPLPQED